MPWNTDKPAMADQIGDSVPDIEENFQYLYDLLTVQEIWVPAKSMHDGKSASPPGAWTGAQYGDWYITYLPFDGGPNELYAGFVLVMPPNWNRGTIKAKFYWTGATGCSAGDTVEWEIQAVAVGNDDALAATAGTSQVISDTLLVNNGTDLQVTGATPAITVAGTPALGDLVYFQVSRNLSGTDDMTEDAYLFGVAIQFSVTNTVTAW
jgi:hypothetical protein